MRLYKLEREEVLKCSALNEASISHPSSRAQGSIQNKGQRRFKSQGYLMISLKQYFHSQQTRWTYELTVAVTAWARLVQPQAWQNYNTEKGKGHEDPPIPGELLAINCC